MSTSNGRGAIINIDQLLAPDITFVIGEERWTIAGNISARTVLVIQKLTNAFDKSMNDGDMDATINAFQDLHDFLLPLFQYKRADLEELPWDFTTFLRVTSIVLARALGAEPEALAEAMSDPPSPTTTSSPKPARSRSTPRAGSARS